MCIVIFNHTQIWLYYSSKYGNCLSYLKSEIEKNYKNDADTVKEIESSVKLTDEEKEAVKAGADIKFNIVVKDEVKAGDKELIDTKISSLVNNGVVGKVFDITIEKQVGSNAAVKAEFNSEITLKVQVPEELINKDDSKTRTYKIIRVHDGEVTVIDKENCVFDEETGLITLD